MTDVQEPHPAATSVQLPLALTALAGLYILVGIGAVLGVARSLAHREINLDFSVLCIFMGWGLLRLKDAWRVWSLFCVWLGAIALVPVCALLYFAHAPLAASAFGHGWTDVSRIWVLALGGLALAFSVWEYKVLTRRDVRQLFSQRLLEEIRGARNKLVPNWFLALICVLAVAQYYVAVKTSRFNNPAQSDNAWHSVGLDLSRFCSIDDDCHNKAIIDDTTNSISIAADMVKSCWYHHETDSEGRAAWINDDGPDRLVFPMIENTLSVQFPDGTKMELPLPANAAKQFVDGYHPGQAGHQPSLLRRALGFAKPSPAKSQFAAYLVAYREPEEPMLLAGVDDPDLMQFIKITPNQSRAKQIAVDKSHALEVVTDAKAQWPSVTIAPKDGKWDLSGFDAATVDLQNPEDTAVRVLMNVNGPGADGVHHCSTDATSVPAHGKATLTVVFGRWYGNPSDVDLKKIASVSVGLDRPGGSRRFLITQIKAVAADRHQVEAAMADPFFKELKPAFGRGINLGNALEAPKEGEWGVTLKESYFEQIAKAGFDSVRIPISWSPHAAKSAPYAIDPKFFDRVDWAIRQALQQKLIPIVDMHHYGELMDAPQKNRERFLALWEQVASHYKDLPAQVPFELLNEPHGKLTADLWNSMLADGIRVIRRTNPTRQIIVGPVGWNAIGELNGLVLPKDDRHLVVTVHYYSPFHFTHQGAEFAGPEAQKWLGTKWTAAKAEKQAVSSDLDTAISWAVKNRRPIYLGEFGAYHKADAESRARWIRFVADEAAKRKMGIGYWEFCSGFGIFNPATDRWDEPLEAALLGK
ncbi:MAG TPA: glycoside hydrolase family 5 protein [Pirellulales bacterium]|nr:glycoside hydrolase family 5 protein [Pirellulales bacterium]